MKIPFIVKKSLTGRQVVKTGMWDLSLEIKRYEVSRSLIFLHLPSHSTTPVLGNRAPKFIVDYCREIVDTDLFNRFGQIVGCLYECISDPPPKEALSNFRIVIFLRTIKLHHFFCTRNSTCLSESHCNIEFENKLGENVVYRIKLH